MNSVRQNHHRPITPGCNENSIIDLIQRRRVLGVTDPRDMVLAHAGFASDGEKIKVDFSKTCNEVYEDIAWYILLEDPTRPFQMDSQLQSSCV
jgi:hypothetical protein